MRQYQKKDIVIHSDDAGATESVTRSIISAWTSGVLDGFSILSNGQATDLITAALASNADRTVRLCAHLNLSEGGSMLPPSESFSLTNAEGNLKHTFFSLLIALLFSTKPTRKTILNQIESEWRVQIQAVRCIAGNRKINALDSHIHVHMLPWTFKIACKLANEFGIKEVRVSREPFFIKNVHDLFMPYYVVNVIKHVVLNTCSFFAVRFAKSFGVEYPAWIIGVLYSGHMTRARALCGIRRIRDNSKIELVFHVGQARNEERSRWGNKKNIADFYLSEQRSVELYEAGLVRNSFDG